MAKIDILLAAFNNAAYLPAQIRSLQNQTFTDWRLLVHDDGSTDDTVSVVREFASADSRITLIEDGVTLRSAQGNFMHLLPFSDAEFAIFCDGDDIWLDNKLAILYDTISQRDNSRPQAVYSNSYVYNPATGEISGSATLCIMRTLHDVLFSNAGVQGCAILFNAKLREVCLRTPEFVAMHDHVLTMAATAFGEFTYVPLHLMLYRRYEGAVTGRTDRTLRERFGHFFQRGKTVLDARHYRGVVAFYEANKEFLTPEQADIFRRFFRYKGRSRISNALHILPDGFKLYGKSTVLIIKLLLRPLL